MVDTFRLWESCFYPEKWPYLDLYGHFRFFIGATWTPTSNMDKIFEQKCHSQIRILFLHVDTTFLSTILEHERRVFVLGSNIQAWPPLSYLYKIQIAVVFLAHQMISSKKRRHSQNQENSFEPGNYRKPSTFFVEKAKIISYSLIREYYQYTRQTSTYTLQNTYYNMFTFWIFYKFSTNINGFFKIFF